MASIKYEPAAIVTVASTELNSLANNAGALGAEYDNATNQNLLATFELTVTFGSAPTANNTVDLYIVPAMDGTNYHDAIAGGSGYAPSTSYAGAFPLRAVTTLQRVPLGVGIQGAVQLPPCKFKLFALNKSGQAFPASGSTIKMIPSRYQSA